MNGIRVLRGESSLSPYAYEGMARNLLSMNMEVGPHQTPHLLVP